MFFHIIVRILLLILWIFACVLKSFCSSKSWLYLLSLLEIPCSCILTSDTRNVYSNSLTSDYNILPLEIYSKLNIGLIKKLKILMNEAVVKYLIEFNIICRQLFKKWKTSYNFHCSNHSNTDFRWTHYANIPYKYIAVP